MRVRLFLVMTGIALVGLGAWNLSHPATAAATDQGGCFGCEGGHKDGDGWFRHNDFPDPWYGNKWKDNYHGFNGLGHCEVHTEYLVVP